MDLPLSGLGDWPTAALAAAVPETAWAALVSAVVTLALALIVLPRRAAETPPLRLGPAEDPAACDFLINGASVRPLTAAARALIASFGTGAGAPLQGLTRHLARDCASIQDDLEGLILFGEGFRRHCARPDGTSYEILGRPEGAAARLTIRTASAEARALDAAERALSHARTDIAFQREALDRAPILVWTLGPDGTLLWANATYRERFDPAEPARIEARPPNAFCHVIEEVPLTARDGDARRRRVRLAASPDGEPHWFEVSERPAAGGGTLCYAVEMDDLVAAEASLRRFVETLTETFAHLPIGLAVFDKNRRLGLFNPALSDLVKIDAVWLAGRPSLRDFLERLRETRQMPEQKDFAAFRRMLTELEEGARDGTYEEHWQLPSGKIFRVSGRPHPQGALAFLFEDISPAIQLERRYRSELELSQATLDRIGEAVAVFDTSGMLVFVNAAFERLWGLDPMAGLDGPTVAEMVAVWAARCAPAPAWERIAAFATGAESRSAWTEALETLAGDRLEFHAAPLPNGSTLVIFRPVPGAQPACEAPIGAPIEARALPSPPPAPAPAPVSTHERLEAAALLGDLARAEIEAPAEAALAALGPAIAATRDAPAHAALAAAARTLKDGLSRARALQDEAEALLAAPADPSGGEALAPRLAGLLALRGLGLALPDPPADVVPDPRLAPCLGALAVAIATLARPGATVTAAPGETRPGLVLTAPARAAPEAEGPDAAGPEPAILALARRRVAALGGRLDLSHADDRVRLAVRLPARRALAEAPDRTPRPEAARPRLAAG